MAESKSEIRKRILRQRQELSPDERERGRILLTERILGHQWFYSSDILLCFAGYGSEIDTREIWQEALKAGKAVYMPKVQRDSPEPAMDFFRIYSEANLISGYRGIPEPVSDDEKYEYLPEHVYSTLMIMPGAAFDRFRNRVGYGKGFYDRFLADKEMLRQRTIAVGFACQMVDEIPCGPEDIRPCQVILV